MDHLGADGKQIAALMATLPQSRKESIESGTLVRSSPRGQIKLHSKNSASLVDLAQMGPRLYAEECLPRLPQPRRAHQRLRALLCLTTWLASASAETPGLAWLAPSAEEEQKAYGAGNTVAGNARGSSSSTGLGEAPGRIMPQVEGRLLGEKPAREEESRHTFDVDAAAWEIFNAWTEGYRVEEGALRNLSLETPQNNTVLGAAPGSADLNGTSSETGSKLAPPPASPNSPPPSGNSTQKAADSKRRLLQEGRPAVESALNTEAGGEESPPGMEVGRQGRAGRRLAEEAGKGPTPSGSPSNASSGGSCCSLRPPAPHLLCCKELTAHRRELDRRAEGGALPAWAEVKEAGGSVAHPRTPWVKGGPRDNLPLTHLVQRDIWAQQFPADDCSGNGTTPGNGGPRFLLAWWVMANMHGLGSHLHLMTEMLALAQESGRVLVFQPGTFERADHEGCKGPHFKSFSCYFFPPTSSKCVGRAMELFQQVKKLPETYKKQFLFLNPWEFQDTSLRHHQLRLALNSSAPLIVASPRFGAVNQTIPLKWGQPWRQSSILQVFGTGDEALETAERQLKINWWRSQAVRFMLRWHSAYLCHIVNFARHQTYGFEVAQHVARTYVHRVTTSLEGISGHNELQGNLVSKGAPGNVGLHADDHENGLNGWQEQSQHCGNIMGGDAFLPKPMVRIHVRGSDKRKEMKIFSLEEYLEAATKLMSNKQQQANKVWLSSEEKAVFDQAKNISSWKFYVLKMDKKIEEGLVRGDDQWLFAKKFGLRDYIEASLANLFISEQCNTFVFALMSNWDRLANELRLTNGGLQYDVFPLNRGV